MNKLFKALDDPTRRRVLELLREGDLNAGEIGAHFGITGASMSHHLGILLEAGLVQCAKSGQQRVYSLNTTVFQDVLEWIYSIKGDVK
ncbi:autorepressor SdpR family transcription factor [Treponema zuelzerae]|uniref:Autorepressor SdpR family transcription factor n=1 Tax=Teretinema zuelzerae TaxID=156 RepID=A0AAE3EJM1_9SPIR|nr:autorepressor SdpR family transcription factor [Teretinema zuelzerae]MCD1655026.1 autorepressor SdpR family transcription factor [Teretinema zuelzerae]